MSLTSSPWALSLSLPVCTVRQWGLVSCSTHLHSVTTEEGKIGLKPTPSLDQQATNIFLPTYSITEAKTDCGETAVFHPWDSLQLIYTKS